jgi:aminopeptidase N
VPADGLIISTNEYNHRTFFGDNWPNRAHNWLPCVDDPADKATVDFIITAPNHYQVVANGAKVSETRSTDNLRTTHWKENAPLSTKVMVIGVANFAIDHTGDVKNIPVYSYVFPENKETGFKAYSVATEILAYYIGKIGPYPFEKLVNVQSKTRFGGLENASAIFYFEKSVDSKDIEELIAHETAHQWFGDAASETAFSHLWLSEGFATFMTNVYLEHKYGIDTLKKRLIIDREIVLKLEKTRKTPVVDTTVKSEYMELLNANSYQKGGWILHMLRHKLGEEAFWKGIRNYYAKYDGGNANTDDLRSILEQASGQDLKQFFKQWLYTPGTPHLSITFNNTGKDMVDLTITQQQDALFAFPLEVSAGGELHTIAIKDKVTHVQFAVKDKSAPLAVDPNVNLLARFEVKEQIQ